MAKARLNTFLLSLILAVSIFFNVGKSNWIIPCEAKANDITINNGSRAVCYNGRTKTKYTTIEKALEVAKDDTANNDTIYVIPGTNPVITRNCEISSGDTLCLPYEDDGLNTHKFLFREDKTANATFGDTNAEKVKANRKSQVSIRDNVTLTNNGTLTVGGSIGYGGSAVGITGQTASSYCEILMQANSTILNYGRLNIYGYVKESKKNNGSKIDYLNNSIVYMPFAIYDFRGGSYSKACYGENIMPFNTFDLPNCQVMQKYNYGSKMYGMATLNTSLGWTKADPLILGNESDACLFKLKNGYINLKYSPSNYLYTTNDCVSSTTEKTANYTNIYTFGDIELASLKLPVLEISIDTQKMFCPLGFKFQITIDQGTFTIANKMKFLGGSSLLIKPNGTLNCNSEVSFYQNYIPAITTGGSNLYPSTFKSSKLINNGTLNANSLFGGLIETEESTGKLNTGDGFINAISTDEALASGGLFLSSYVDKKETHTENALGFLGASAKPSNPSLVAPSKTYESKGDFWYAPLTDITSVGISPNSGTSAANSVGEFSLTALISPVENSSSEIVYQWSCTEGATLSSTSGETVTLTIPANSTNSDKTYNVTCKVNFKKSDGSYSSVTAIGTYTAAKKSGGGCFAKGTLIELSDGSSKKIEDLSVGDIIQTFNHENGSFEAQPITYIPHHSRSVYEVLELEFEGPKKIKVLFAHGFMNAKTRKYEEISPQNVENKIGENYIFVNGSSLVSKKLLSYRLYEEETECYSLSSAYNLNHIANGALCISDDISGLYNYFELDENFKYDPVKKQQDIKKFGLLSYDEVAYFMSRDIYDLFNVKYLSVSIGKGMITMEKMEEYIKKFA